jgi:hypothetical protein
MDKQIENRNLIQKSDVYKSIPEGTPLDNLNEYFYVNILKSKIEEKIRTKKVKLFKFMCQFYPGKISKYIDRPLHGEQTEAIEDYYENENHIILLAKTIHTTTKNPIITTQRYFYDVYDSKNKLVLSFLLPSNLKTIDTFTASIDNTIFFTIGTDNTNTKILTIQTKSDALFDEEVETQRKSTILGTLTSLINPVPKKIYEEYDSITLNLNDPISNYIGIKFLVSGELALLKEDKSVSFMNLKKQENLKSIVQIKPSQITTTKKAVQKINNNTGMYTTFAAAALVGLAWYYNPSSIVETFTSFFRSLRQLRIEN